MKRIVMYIKDRDNKRWTNAYQRAVSGFGPR